MPRNVSVAIENKFIKGLVTEATGLNFPENACTETENCVFDKTGEVSRRLGIDYEVSSISHPIPETNMAVTEFLWEGISKSGDVIFLVLQIGNIIRFFQVFGAPSVSNFLKGFTIDLNGFRVTTSIPPATTTNVTQNHCSFASGNGLLFITHPFCDPIYVEYDVDTDTIKTTKIIVKIRDTDGLPNNSQVTGLPMEYNHRPSNVEFNEAVYYNILNQGWYTRVVSTPEGRHWDTIAPLIAWRKGSTAFATGGHGPLTAVPARIDWPSEADIWHMYKGIVSLAGITQPNHIPPAEVFSLQAIDQVDLGNTPAGKGHFILEAFNENRVAAVNTEDVGNARGIQIALGQIKTFPDDPLKGTRIIDKTAHQNRPSQTAFYAGRVWYAAVASKDYNTKIFFTQILEGTKNVDRCYQSQDPTSEVSSDLLPSDGGVIVIPDIAKVVKLFVMGSSLLVFATNGIWKISGSTSEALGFTANDFAITKLDDTNAISALSFVDVAGIPMWWNLEGIWTIKPNQQSGGADVLCLTETTIQSYFNKIPSNEIQWVKGAYEPLSKIVQWLFRSTPSSTLLIHTRYEYDTVLNLDTSGGMFYPWTLDDTAFEYICGIVPLLGSFQGRLQRIFKYITQSKATNSLRFSEFRNLNFRDWPQASNRDYSSFITTGYKLRGEAIRKFQNNYIQLYTRNDLPSIFDIHSKWDYSTSGNTGRWSSVQRVTIDNISTLDTGVNYSYRTKRLKIRGHGKALQFKMSSISEEPFNIIGWVTWDSTNAAA